MHFFTCYICVQLLKIIYCNHIIIIGDSACIANNGSRASYAMLNYI